MKKFLSILLVAVFIISIANITVFARGGYGHGANGRNTGSNTAQSQTLQQTRFEICTLDDCNVAGPHQHDKIWYCSQHYLQDGLGLCPLIGDCTIRGLHEHDGVYYHCEYYSTDFGCGNKSAGRGAGCGYRR